jgi:hypothetical protein
VGGSCSTYGKTIIEEDLMGKPEGKRRSVRPRCRWENKKWNLNVKLYIRNEASFTIN